MADAPSTSTYILVAPDAIDLPNSRTLFADAFGSQLEYSDGGPAGTFEIKPTLTLKSITELNAAGMVAFDGANTVAPRTLTSVSTLNITRGNGLGGNPILDVIDDTSIQKVSIAVNGGANVGSRSQLNLINGLGVSITAIENPGDNTIDITINASNPPDVGSFFLASASLGHTANLGLLTTGILKINVAAGIASPVIAAPGIDYVAPTTSLLELSSCVSSVGALIHGTGAGWQTLPVGTANQVLTVVAGQATWANTALASNATYITRNATNLPPNGFSLGSLATGLLKITVAGSSATPSTAVDGTDYLAPNANLNQLATCGAGTGTIIYANGSGWQTLAPGTNAQVLTITGGNVGWANSGLSTNATYLCRNGTNLPPSGVNLSAGGAFLSVGRSSSGAVVLDLENLNQTCLRITSNNASVVGDFSTYSGGAIQGTNVISMRSHRGTSGAPSPVVAGDILSDIQTFGYWNAGYSAGTSIRAEAEQNFSATTGRTALKVFTRNDQDILREHWKIAGRGNMFSTPSLLNDFEPIYAQIHRNDGPVTGIYQEFTNERIGSGSITSIFSILDSQVSLGGGGQVLRNYTGTGFLGASFTFSQAKSFFNATNPNDGVSEIGDVFGAVAFEGTESGQGRNIVPSLASVIDVRCTNANWSDTVNRRALITFAAKTGNVLTHMVFENGTLTVNDLASSAGFTYKLNVIGSTGYNNVGNTAWAITSDERIKHNIKDIENGLAIVDALQPRTFSYTQDWVDSIKNTHITSDDKFYGFIAQEVEKIIPDAVEQTENKIGSVENIKNFNIHALNVILFQAVKELSAKVTALETQIAAIAP